MMSSLQLPALEVRRGPPENLQPSDVSLFAHEYKREIPDCSSQIIRRVKVLPNGYLLKGILPLRQSFAVSRGLYSHGRRVAAAVVGKAQASSAIRVERALFATDEFSNGFFHWICDVLPRLEAMDRSARGESETRTLVVPAMASFPCVTASLAAFRLGGVRILGSREKALCEDLLWIPPVAPTGNYRPELMDAVRTRFRSFYSEAGGAGRLFISRSKAARRRIHNEEQILPVLRDQGFTVLSAEDLPLEDQVRRIGAASILVGNHGAGLTHMLWMRPGTCVVELRRRGDRWNNCYFSLASALGIRYFYMLCDAATPRGDTHSTDIIVDPRELGRLLQSAAESGGTQ